MKRWKDKHSDLKKRLDACQGSDGQKTESLRVSIELLRDKNQELEVQVSLFILHNVIEKVCQHTQLILIMHLRRFHIIHTSDNCERTPKVIAI